MSKRRITQDHYFKRAKSEGHSARSVYKLEEIDKRYRLLHGGQHVLDLGAAPGSWLTYAARKVGPRGHCVGLDLKPIRVTLPTWAEAHLADAFELSLDETFDVVLSDMAPATMGHHGTDALRSAALATRALDVAEALLRPDGHVVVKVLEGQTINELGARIKANFHSLQRLRPRATRAQSSEIFLIGMGRKAAQASRPPSACQNACQNA